MCLRLWKKKLNALSSFDFICLDCMLTSIELSLKPQLCYIEFVNTPSNVPCELIRGRNDKRVNLNIRPNNEKIILVFLQIYFK